MLEESSPARDELPAEERGTRLLAVGFAALAALTFGLIVLGALVRAHGAGLACPDWPLCFGELVPRMDLRVGFEWAHRAVAGSVALVFAGLAALVLRRPGWRQAAGGLVAIAAALLAAQILLGALTVWKLLAAWTVTAHLLTGHGFAMTLLWIACALHERADSSTRLTSVSTAARALVFVAALLLLFQLVLGGLVASRFAGLACPEWPTCSGGVWFPSWQGSVGLHLLHRMSGYALLVALLAAALASREVAGLRIPTSLALALGAAQVIVGIANVLLAIPVEMTGLHSALAAALTLTFSLAVREVWLRPPRAAA